MSPNSFVVIVAGVIGIAFTAWFFFMKKDTEVVVSGAVDIVVDGGYTPAVIVVAKDKAITITFTRKDPSPCLEEVILSDFSIRNPLPLHHPVAVSITPRQAGEFPFSCGMNMFHGKVIVR